jgi:Uma2 family endonuclease
MATLPTPSRWTYEQFAQLPDDGNRYEVIAGELYVTPAPRPRHQEVVVRLIVRLAQFVEQHRLGKIYPGPIDVLFAEGDYLEPDLIFVRRDRLSLVSERGIEGPPDLVVEILSHSTAKRDRTIKRDRYAFFGVPEYWVLDSEARRLEVYHPGSRPAEIVEAAYTWQPVAGGPALLLQVKELFETTL